MDTLFYFKANISRIKIREQLNNPFGTFIPEIVSIAAKEFQAYISSVSSEWAYDFSIQKGKMFGILVVQQADQTYAYLGTNSGKFPGHKVCNKFVPSIFDDAVDDFFINKGMTELTEIGHQIINEIETIPKD